MKPITLLFIASLSALHLFPQARVEVSRGTTITNSSGINIVLDEISLKNDGVIKHEAGGGSYLFRGSGENYISGTGQFQFDKFILARSASSILFLKTDIAVSGTLQFEGGRLNLLDNHIQLGTTGILKDESKTSHIFSTGRGYIEAKNIGSDEVIIPGNLGIIITASAGLGNITVRRGHVSLYSNDVNDAITRYYDIVTANSTNVNASIRFRYFDGEGDNKNESTFAIFKRSDGIGWMNLGADARSVTSNYIEKRNVSIPGRFAVSTPGYGLKSDGTASFLLWPNPVIQIATIVINSQEPGSINLLVCDVKGAIVLEQHSTLGKGYNKIDVDMQKLPQGSYTVLSRWNGNTKVTTVNKF